MKKCNLADRNTVSVGVIDEIKTRDDGAVKYKIAYKDYKGRTFTAWTSWMRDDGYRLGDSIPVNNLAIPSFGLVNVPLAVNNCPQKHVEPYVAAMVLAGIGALIAGYHIGKSKK